MNSFVRFVSLFVIAAVFVAGGCDKKESTTAEKADAPTASPAKRAVPLVSTPQIADWCPEHGVPESVCTRCNESLVAGFKEKKDWCGSHNVPESQCFTCHPELKEKFAAEYKAKYGKDAPAVGSEHK